MQVKRKVDEVLSVTVLEDNQGDYILIEDYLYESFKSIQIDHYLDFKSLSASLQQTANHCDLILIDLHLPDMSGLELITSMLTLSLHTPIIVLTGYSELPIAKKSLELGIYDFLVKDEITPSLLHKSIEFALSRNSYLRHVESQNEKLKKIAWTQSHVVRAPLARILGIINVIENLEEDYSTLPFYLEQLKISSNEMDEIIRSIVKETQTLDL